ncbi:MAG: hypothetical protein IT244_10060 [Bacteroidia bacterium]|nr:hypothetical protein [Bacteroidia bacterium]
MDNILTHENYENIFFKLIEKEFDKEDSKKILAEINNDPFFSFEWECWQKAVLVDGSKQIGLQHASFFDAIKSEADLFVTQKKKRTIPFYYRATAIAASLCICAVAGYILLNPNTQQSVRPVKGQEPVVVADKSNSKLVVPATPTHKPAGKPQIWPVKENYMPIDPPDDAIIPDKFLDPENIPIYTEAVPVKSNVDSGIAATVVVKTATPQTYKRKFSVSAEQAITDDLIVKLSDLEATQTNLLDYFENKRVAIVRINKKLYLKLTENDDSYIYLSLK